MQFTMYLFLIYCIIFHSQHIFVMAIYGPTARLANNNEFPGVISIMPVEETDSNETEIELDHQCTGTLISRQDIVTAEHCLRTIFTEGFKILVGSIDLRHTTELYPMFVMSYEHWILFRQRTLRFYDHDICLVKLLDNVPEIVEISPLGNIESNLLYGVNAQITGWGKLTNGTKPRFLHTATVRIMSNSECEHRIHVLAGLRFTIDNKILCTVGDPYAVLGYGDSGGPLTYFGSIVAINNGVIPKYNHTTRPDQINLHLNLRFYHEFIQDIIIRFRMDL